MKDNNLPLVSVIIRSMDRPELADALKSVAEQRYPNVEVVLVNAKGQEHAEQGEWCGNFPLRTVGMGHQLPRSKAANVGLEHARGEYVIFLDDDDWFLDHHVQDLAKILIHNQDIGAAYAAVQCVRQSEDGSWEQEYLFNQPFDRIRLFVENYLPMHACLFCRSLLQTGCCFDEGLDTYEDWDFWIQLARKTNFYFVHHIGAMYRIGSESGFGMAGQDKHVDEALRIFFHKWRFQWTDDELAGIVSYAKYHSMYWDVRELLTSVQEERAQEVQKLESANSALYQAWEKLDKEYRILIKERDTLLEEKNRLDQASEKLLQDNQTLIGERDKLLQDKEQLTTLVNSQSEDVNRLQAYLREMESSTSWKITAPLRAGADFLRGVKRWISVSTNVLQRMIKQGIQVWKAEGIRAVMLRAKSKFSHFTYERKRRAREYGKIEIGSEYYPLSFPSVDSPQFSIIIPVHNEYAYTFHCLESVLENTKDESYEIIVVNDCSEDETRTMLQSISGIHVLSTERQSGFVLACNHGAAQARGEYLLFLNNDTQVTEGWLPALQRVLSEDDRVGLVGAKLVYPDGTLQEAGGIVWRDGSAWNYGRGDKADKPEYNYLRPADYCSGACLAIKKVLFQKLGGFDQQYVPAYGEDMDLAFKVRAAGFKVLYQPAAEVVHFEGVSTQKSMYSGIKAYQVVNQQKFATVWQDALRTHRVNGSNVHLEKDRFACYRMLILDQVMITPDMDSGSLRMFNLLQELVSMDMKVVFATMYLDAKEPYTRMLQDLGVEVLYPPHVRTVEQYLQAHGRDFDLVLLSRSDVAEFFLDLVRRHAPSAFVIFDTVDLHYLREERMAEIHESRSMLSQAAKRKQTELDLVCRSDMALVVSSYEQELLQTECPQSRVEILSNIHDVYPQDVGFEDREGILFIGGFNHPPNTDAAIFLVREILPLVYDQLGQVPTYLIGSQPTRQVCDLASDLVQVPGYVPDIEPYFSQIKMSVAPLRYGAGVKGKVNMSMAYGVPVVATSIAVEGMHLEHGRDVMVGDDPEAFARHVVRVYQEPELWASLRTNGIENIERHFSRRVARETVHKILAEVDQG